jgi:REP element-mobilizing transposase RayT
MSLGKIVSGKMRLSGLGKAAGRCWQEIPSHFPFVKLDEFIIMPNHIHGIIVIDKDVGTQNFAFLQNQENRANSFGPQKENLSSIIRGFKIGVTKYAKENHIQFVWQPRFYDRIVRNEKELEDIRQYIVDNPLKWDLDRNNIESLYI